MENHSGHEERYAFFRDRIAGEKVLDTACSFGGGTAILAEKAKEVVGIDIDDEQLGHAEHNNKNPNVMFERMDATNMTFADNFFDAAVASEVIEHVNATDQRKMLGELQRVVKPGGAIFISTPDKYVWHEKMAISWDEHICELTRDEFETLAGEYFDVQGTYGQWKLQKTSSLKEAERWVLNLLKKMDVFNLRHSLFSKNVRNNIDKNTSLVDWNQWDIEVLKPGEVAAQQLVVCTNRK